jgi:hypothetical protein
MNRSTFFQKVVDECNTTRRLNFPPFKECEILKACEDAITYRRGQSQFKVRISDLYDATEHFSGYRVKTSDIRKFRPNVFDSKARPAGHSCNISLLFMLLLRLKIARELQGRGVSGDPYSVFIDKKDV